VKRPLLLFAISLIAGIISIQLKSLVIFLLISGILISIVLAVFCLKYRKYMLVLIGIIAFYFLGAVEFSVLDNINSNKYVDYNGKEVEIRGVISEEPQVKDLKTIYTVKTQQVLYDKNAKNIKGKILITVPRNNNEQILEYGRKIRVVGQINLPSGKRIEGGFDYKKHLAKSGVSASMFARSQSIHVEEGFGGSFIVRIGLELRKRIVDSVYLSLPKEQAGLMSGMLIGYTEGMGERTEEVFSNAGLSHLTAVSGMNVAFIAFPLVFLFKKLGLGQKISNILIILVLILFIFITGFSPSVSRAVIMAIVLLIGQLITRETDVYTSIAFAAILLLVSNPFTIFDIGFQLSFGATLSLILFYKNISEKLNFRYLPGIIKNVLAATLAAQIGVIPISALYFNKISLISLLSNLFVVPIVEVITIIGMIMVVVCQLSPFVSEMIGLVNTAFLSFILMVAKLSSQIPYAVVKIATPSLPTIISYYFIVVFFFWYKPLYKVRLSFKHYVILTAIFFTFVGFELFLPNKMQVIFIDVGQGDSILIKTAEGKTVLIDGGGYASKTDFKHNMGDYTVVPFLYDYGVTELDMVIATHDHDDHIQGLKTVINDIKTNNLIISDETENLKELLDIAHLRKIPSKILKSGDKIIIDNDSFMDVIYPILGYSLGDENSNNSSLVLKLCYKNIKILFTGDIEKEGEKLILDNKIFVGADVLKVAHHGSSTSTSEEFLLAVAPKAAVISVGKNNFGHPSKSVIARLKKHNVSLFRTDMDGTIVLSSNGKTIEFRKTIR